MSAVSRRSSRFDFFESFAYRNVTLKTLAMRHIIITFDGRIADEPLYSGVDLLRFLALRGGFPTYIRALRRYMVVFATGRLMCFAARSAFNDD